MLKDKTIKDLVRLKTELERKADGVRSELTFIERDIHALERIILMGLDGNPVPDVVVRQTNKRRFKNGELLQLVLRVLKEESGMPLSKNDIAKRLEHYAPDVQDMSTRLDRALPKYRASGAIEEVERGPRNEILWQIARPQAAKPMEESSVIPLRK